MRFPDCLCKDRRRSHRERRLFSRAPQIWNHCRPHKLRCSLLHRAAAGPPGTNTHTQTYRHRNMTGRGCIYDIGFHNQQNRSISELGPYEYFFKFCFIFSKFSFINGIPFEHTALDHKWSLHTPARYPSTLC